MTTEMTEQMGGRKAPIDRLRTTGEKLPPRLRDEILALGAEAIPALIELLTDDDLGREDAPGQGYPPIHAVDLLADLKAVEAVEPMLDVLVETDLDHIINSRLIRRLPEFGERVLEPALSRLADVKVDAGSDTDAQYALVTVLSQLGVRDERIFEAICRLFDDDLVFGAVSFGYYSDRRALPLLEAEILDFVPDMSDGMLWRMNLNELLDAHERLGGVLSDELRGHVASVDAQAESYVAQRTRTAPKVGRNDPCPCGSGKKYKKCCIDVRETSPTPNVITRAGDRLHMSGDVTPERLAMAERFFADKDAGRGPAQQMMDYIQPLLEDEDERTPHRLKTALDLGMLFWNLAVTDAKERDAVLAKMAGAFEGDERAVFEGLAEKMIERHIAMFPELHARRDVVSHPANGAHD